MLVRPCQATEFAVNVMPRYSNCGANTPMSAGRAGSCTLAELDNYLWCAIASRQSNQRCT